MKSILNILNRSEVLALLVFVSVIGIVFGVALIAKALKASVKFNTEGERIVDTRLALDRIYPLRPIYNIFSPIIKSISPRFESDIYHNFKLAGRPAFIGKMAKSDEVFAVFACFGIFAIGVSALLCIIAAVTPVMMIVFSIAGGALTYFVMTLWLNGEAIKRQTSIDNEFPNYLDQSIMAIGAGAKVEDTFELYSNGRRPSPLTEELALVYSEIESGSVFMDAMQNLRSRTDALSIEVTVNELVTSVASGTPVTSVMEVAAKDLRDFRTANAEQMGEKLKSKIIIPSLLMAASAMIFIMGPAFIEMMDSELF